VDLESIRAKHLRNFDFGKGLSRIDARANIADLTYDVKVPSPRVQGNPMIAQQVSRVKREAVLAAKSGAADVTYDVRPPPLWPAGAIDFSRHVDRHTHVAGRGHPSERMRDRERHEHGGIRCRGVGARLSAPHGVLIPSDARSHSRCSQFSEYNVSTSNRSRSTRAAIREKT
jgi:hypothetical protein